MRGFGLVVAVWLLVQVTEATREKPGVCNNRFKREQCQCSPHGNDDCSDDCSDDYDCSGQRKCCTIVCKRVCTLSPYRPDFRCPPDQVPDACPPPTDPTCPSRPPVPVPPLPPPPAPPSPPIYTPPWNSTACVPRCVCRPGYVRAEDGSGKCIRKTKCPPAPPPSTPICNGFHEIYYPCYEGCQGSCENPNGDGCVVRSCVRGCFCAPGLVRNGHGRCIRVQACPPAAILKRPPAPSPPLCPENQEFSSCRRECEATCINKQPRGCFRRCQAGCFCKNPYVRDHYGNCVHPDHCVVASTIAPRCGYNEEYRFCSTKCQGTCENPRAENCYARCQTGCFCIDGYVRTENGECLRAEECLPAIKAPPPTPGRPVCESDLEEYLECHRGCQRSCDNPDGQGCSTEECHSGCYCQAGLVRNHLGHCVPQHACESIGCGYHEHYEECGPTDPATCRNDSSGGGYGSVQPPVDQQCQSGCFCDEGYIRKEGACVSVNQCRNRGQQCASYEDPVPCGQVCERECRSGWSTQSCPTACRRRCCRRRFIRV